MVSSEARSIHRQTSVCSSWNRRVVRYDTSIDSSKGMHKLSISKNCGQCYLIHNSFEEACSAIGLLADDKEFVDTIKQRNWHMEIICESCMLLYCCQTQWANLNLFGSRHGNFSQTVLCMIEGDYFEILVWFYFHISYAISKFAWFSK